MPIRSPFVPLVVLALALPRPAHAQRPDMRDADFATAVQAILTHDHFATKCLAGKGYSSNDAAAVAEWKVANKVELVRVRLAELDADPGQARLIADVRAGILRKYGNLSFLACRAAVQATKRPEAQIASNAPRMLAALAAPAAASVAASPAAPTGTSPESTPPVGARPAPLPEATGAPAPAPTAPAPAAAGAATPALLDAIEAFAFDSRAAMGIGGFMTTEIYPIVLFRDGSALTDAEGLGFAGGIEAHRRAHADDWTRWRRAGGELQVMKRRGWERPSFQRTYGKLPADFRLDGFFRALGGAGTLAVGGTSEVTAWTDYRFTRDGRVTRGGGAGSRSEAGDVSTTTRASARGKSGHYSVDGLVLRITYDDGSTESRVLIADPQDPRTGIWLDGHPYPRRGER